MKTKREPKGRIVPTRRGTPKMRVTPKKKYKDPRSRRRS